MNIVWMLYGCFSQEYVHIFSLYRYYPLCIMEKCLNNELIKWENLATRTFHFGTQTWIERKQNRKKPPQVLDDLNTRHNANTKCAKWPFALIFNAAKYCFCEILLHFLDHHSISFHFFDGYCVCFLSSIHFDTMSLFMS